MKNGDVPSFFVCLPVYQRVSNTIHGYSWIYPIFRHQVKSQWPRCWSVPPHHPSQRPRSQPKASVFGPRSPPRHWSRSSGPNVLIQNEEFSSRDRFQQLKNQPSSKTMYIT